MQQQGLEIGSVVADYRIESLLGRGGQGIVYLAEHVHLQRKVAFKVLPPELAADESFRKRFLREARLAASLDHPNILDVYDAGEADGRLYLAVRLVRGSDLGAVLEREGPLPLDRTVSIIRDVADALEAAHDAGLVHRDVKPGNILLDVPGGRRGREHVYLADFGLTKPLAPEPGGPSTGSLTMTGYFVGTADYAAPEQIEGRELDRRTDVYSLGCVLYQCLTGEVPFPRDTLASSIVAHMTAPPPEARLKRGDVPDAVDRVITRAMAKEPADRFQSCEEMADELGRAAGFWASTPPAPLTGTGPGEVRSPSVDVPPPAPTRPHPPPAPVAVPPRPGFEPARPAPPGPPDTGASPKRPSRRGAAVIGGIAALAVVVAAATFALVGGGKPSAAPSESVGPSPSVSPTGPPVGGSCTSVVNVRPFGTGRDDTAHVGEPDFPQGPPLADYPSQPPTSGPHDPATVAAGFYSSPPNIYRAIHSLEHAAVIVWYRPDQAGSDGLNAVIRETRGDDHVIIAPYDYPEAGGALPENVRMTLVAWHRLQRCTQVDPAAVTEFVKKFRFNPAQPSAYRGEAPETGVRI